MRAPIPRNLEEVRQRRIQLQYTSRLTLDEKFFGKINELVDLIAQADRELPPDSPLKGNTTYQSLLKHRKINHFSVVTSTLSADLSDPLDFSRSTIEERIECGYKDALRQGIGAVGSPGLRPGTTDGGGQEAGPRQSRQMGT